MTCPWVIWDAHIVLNVIQKIMPLPKKGSTQLISYKEFYVTKRKILLLRKRVQGLLFVKSRTLPGEPLIKSERNLRYHLVHHLQGSTHIYTHSQFSGFITCNDQHTYIYTQSVDICSYSICVLPCCFLTRITRVTHMNRGTHLTHMNRGTHLTHMNRGTHLTHMNTVTHLWVQLWCQQPYWCFYSWASQE